MEPINYKPVNDYQIEEHGDAQIATINGGYAGVFRRVECWKFEPRDDLSEAAKARLKMEFRGKRGYSGRL